MNPPQNPRYRWQECSPSREPTLSRSMSRIEEKVQARRRQSRGRCGHTSGAPDSADADANKHAHNEMHLLSASRTLAQLVKAFVCQCFCYSLSSSDFKTWRAAGLACARPLPIGRWNTNMTTSRSHGKQPLQEPGALPRAHAAIRHVCVHSHVCGCLLEQSAPSISGRPAACHPADRWCGTQGRCIRCLRSNETAGARAIEA